VLSKCANPECSNSFEDCRQGRLFRFHLNHPGGTVAANAHGVLHLWLCSSCSEVYTLAYRDDQYSLMVRSYTALPNGVVAKPDMGCRKLSQPVVVRGDSDTDLSLLRPGYRLVSFVLTPSGAQGEVTVKTVNFPFWSHFSCSEAERSLKALEPFRYRSWTRIDGCAQATSGSQRSRTHSAGLPRR
jgi:hypothetical protein